MVVTLTSERWIGPGCTSRRPRSGATSLRRILAMERQPAIAGRPRWAATASDSRPRPRGHGPVAGGEHGREVRGAEWRRLARGPDRRRSAGSRRGREPVRARLRRLAVERTRSPCRRRPRAEWLAGARSAAGSPGTETTADAPPLGARLDGRGRRGASLASHISNPGAPGARARPSDAASGRASLTEEEAPDPVRRGPVSDRGSVSGLLLPEQGLVPSVGAAGVAGEGGRRRRAARRGRGVRGHLTHTRQRRSLTG